MAEETKKLTPELVVSDVPVVEKSAAALLNKELQLNDENVEKGADVVAEAEDSRDNEKEKGEAPKENVISESTSFKEESNKADELTDPEKKSLDEFKILIQEALSRHEFTVPPLAAAAKEEDKKEKDPEPDENKEQVEPKTVEKTESSQEALPAAGKLVKEDVAEKKTEKSAEEINQSIFQEVSAPVLPCVEQAATPAEEKKDAPPPLLPEEIFIWGVRLLADEKSDAILLKFLRARDFKVKEAFVMLKSVAAWRKEFKMEELLEEENIIEGLEKVVYMHGVDKEGHPVCYNALGEFQNKELYDNTFADSEKRARFLKWYIQFLERNIRRLDFSPEGICTILQIIDLKNSPRLILFKKELRQATNQALQLLQDNYPEFVAKQVFINVPWWYIAYNRMISPFLTHRTKSKFVFAGSTKTVDTLFKYIAPEKISTQYGGLSKHGDEEFTIDDAAIEDMIKPTCKHTIEFPITEACPLIWEVRVVGWEVSYGAEFVPSSESGYTLIIQKARKIAPNEEQVISCSFRNGEAGKVVVTFSNQTSKRKKLLYRSKIKPYE